MMTTTGADPAEAESDDIDAPRRLLSGVCRLTFEGQRFVPDDDRERQCWLEMSEIARAQLSEMLGPHWNPTFDDFHAEFWGIMYCTPDGCGHFNMFKSFARVDELVFARILPPATPLPPLAEYNGIRARLEAARTIKR